MVNSYKMLEGQVRLSNVSNNWEKMFLYTFVTTQIISAEIQMWSK